MIETLEEANAAEDPRRREELLTYVFVGGGYSGLEALAELQDFAADAMDRYPRARLHGMRWILIEATDRVLPEVPPDLAEYALRQLRGRGIDIRLGTRLEEAGADSVRLSTGERGPDQDARLDRRGEAAPEPRLALAAARRGRPRAGRRADAGRGHARRLGDRRLRRGAVPGQGRPVCPPTAAMAVRQGPAVARNVAAELGVETRPRRFTYLGRESFVNLGRYKAVGQDRAAEVPRLRRLVDGAHLPHEPDPGRRRARSARSSTGPSACRSRRDTAEVGSIGHPRPLSAEVYARGGTHRPLD